MRSLILTSAFLTFAGCLHAQEPTIAIIGLRHSHVWGHIGKMIEGKPARLVGIAETLPVQIEEAKKRGAAANLFYTDYKKMLDETKPTMVWAFVENNRHLEIIEACAPRKIHVIFEKPLAATHRDAMRIRQLALGSGIHVMTNYQMAWWGANYTAKKTADSGALGMVWRLRGIVGHGGPGAASGLNKVFVDWLADPEKNGAGALMDFGCYNALWSLWYLGKPESVFAHVNQLRPDEFPKVEDNSTFILTYKNGVGLFEGSWDLPRSFQDLEVFGRSGSLHMVNGKVELRKGRGAATEVPIEPLPPERAEPIAYMVDCIRKNRAPEGMLAIDINVDVVEIIDALKLSLKEKKAVRLN
ncbi:MAG: Gfo/Idh/MocA family oxidoreductase [Candidatus Solibacter usitatus]|nr:Gfo/Idh/MocA family oxidoreductase [Candidatus Solibacter usitatus]